MCNYKLKTVKKSIKFAVLTAVVMKIATFWVIAPCSPYMNRSFGGTYRLHLQGRKSAKQETSERCQSE
jgi:hypothetical protein